MCAASQLTGWGPLMWMLPLYLHVDKTFGDDDDDDEVTPILPIKFPFNWPFNLGVQNVIIAEVTIVIVIFASNGILWVLIGVVCQYIGDYRFK